MSERDSKQGEIDYVYSMLDISKQYREGRKLMSEGGTEILNRVKEGLMKKALL